MKDPVKRLIDELSLLPGIGERTALRLILHLLEQKRERIFSLAESLIEVAKHVKECSLCCNLTTNEQLCAICEKPSRDSLLVCVVSSIQDLMAIESSASFKGVYHVLHGVLHPLNGVYVKDLRIQNLISRVKERGTPKEMILATPATIEGEATALYLKEIFAKDVKNLSRIATGIPVGGDLQFADRLSLARAMVMRQDF